MIAEIQQAQRVGDVEHSHQKSGVAARLQGASKNYENVRALDNVDFDVRTGELIALLGPNGAGKTTTVKLFLGLASPDSGVVSVFGGNP